MTAPPRPILVHTLLRTLRRRSSGPKGRRVKIVSSIDRRPTLLDKLLDEFIEREGIDVTLFDSGRGFERGNRGCSSCDRGDSFAKGGAIAGDQVADHLMHAPLPRFRGDASTLGRNRCEQRRQHGREVLERVGDVCDVVHRWIPVSAGGVPCEESCRPRSWGSRRSLRGS